MSAAKISIASQIAEVKRELALRANTYPRLVGSAKMRQGEADLCTARMEAVLVTLEFCQRHEAALRTFLAGRLYTAEELTEHVTAAVDAANRAETAAAASVETSAAAAQAAQREVDGLVGPLWIASGAAIVVIGLVLWAAIARTRTGRRRARRS